MTVPGECTWTSKHYLLRKAIGLVAILLTVPLPALGAPPEDTHSDAISNNQGVGPAARAQTIIDEGDLRLSEMDHEGAIYYWSRAESHYPIDPQYHRHRAVLLAKIIRTYGSLYRHSDGELDYLRKVTAVCSEYLAMWSSGQNLDARLVEAECNAAKDAMRRLEFRQSEDELTTRRAEAERLFEMRRISTVTMNDGTRAYVIGEEPTIKTVEELLVKIGHEDLVLHREQQRKISTRLLASGGVLMCIGVLGGAALVGIGASSRDAGYYKGASAFAGVAGIGLLVTVIGAPLPRTITHVEANELILEYNLGLEHEFGRGSHDEEDGQTISWFAAPLPTQRGVEVVVGIRF